MLLLSGVLFAIAVAGIFINRKNIILLLMCIELLLLSVNFNFVAFSRYLGNIDGQVFVFFVLTVAAAESAIGLAILVVLFRERRSINVDDISTLKGSAVSLNPTSAAGHSAAAAAGRDHRRPVRRASSAAQPGRDRDHPGRGGVLPAVAAGVQAAVFDGAPVFNEPVYTWLVSDGIRMQIGFLVDPLTVMMMVVVTFVSLCVHVYTIGYMARRPGLPALLQLHLAVHLRHADAGDVQQLPAAVLRLGSGGRGVLPADRLLVHAADGHLRQHEGLPGQPRGRLRLRAGHRRHRLFHRLAAVRRRLRGGRRASPAADHRDLRRACRGTR